MKFVALCCLSPIKTFLTLGCLLLIEFVLLLRLLHYYV